MGVKTFDPGPPPTRFEIELLLREADYPTPWTGILRQLLYEKEQKVGNMEPGKNFREGFSDDENYIKWIESRITSLNQQQNRSELIIQNLKREISNLKALACEDEEEKSNGS